MYRKIIQTAIAVIIMMMTSTAVAQLVIIDSASSKDGGLPSWVSPVIIHNKKDMIFSYSSNGMIGPQAFLQWVEYGPNGLIKHNPITPKEGWSQTGIGIDPSDQIAYVSYRIEDENGIVVDRKLIKWQYAGLFNTMYEIPAEKPGKIEKSGSELWINDSQRLICLTDSTRPQIPIGGDYKRIIETSYGLFLIHRTSIKYIMPLDSNSSSGENKTIIMRPYDQTQLPGNFIHQAVAWRDSVYILSSHEYGIFVFNADSLRWERRLFATDLFKLLPTEVGGLLIEKEKTRGGFLWDGKTDTLQGLNIPDGGSLHSVLSGNFIIIEKFERKNRFGEGENWTKIFLAKFDFSADTKIQENNFAANFSLKQNYPNPFNPRTTIQYKLPLQKKVSLKIYNIRGQLVKTVVNGQLQNAGLHGVVWDGSNRHGVCVASGIYFYSLEVGGKALATKRMLLLK